MKDILENLIQSKVKRKMLKLFVFNKNKKYHTRELSRIINEPISAVQRELKKLVALQLIVKCPEGNLVNYFVNTQNPFYEDIRLLILKTSTEPKDYFKALINTKTLNKIYLYGEAVKYPMKFSEPIKLLIVGTLDRTTLDEYIKAIMEIFNREYQLTYISPDEFKAAMEKDKSVQAIMRHKYLLELKDT